MSARSAHARALAAVLLLAACAVGSAAEQQHPAGLPKQPRSTVPVVFRFRDPTASTANLAGDFNDWCFVGDDFDTSIDPMSGPDANGWWTLERSLETGYWEYKFVTEGHIWHTDPLNPLTNPDDHDNSVLTVTDPLAYYMSPMDGTTTGLPRPEIGAYLAKSAGETFSLSQLRIYIDDQIVALGPTWFDAATSRVSYTYPHDLPNGPHEAKIRISLTSGASAADSSEFYVKADAAPPVIEHTPPSSIVGNAPVVIECTITDDVGVNGAIVYFRNAGDATFSDATMSGGLDDQWAGTVPAGFTDAGVNLEYYIEASDLTNTTRSPEEGLYSVAVSTDDEPPVISEAFASPSTFDPNGVDETSRLSFRLSEPASVTVEVTSIGGSTIRTLLNSASLGAGYHHVVWDGSTDGGGQIADGAFRFHINAVDTADIQAEPVAIDVTVDQGSQPPPLNVILLFHANQNVNYQGDTANDVCFNGLLRVLRQHPQSRFMLHFSGTLLHDLGWFNFRHTPSTLQMLRDGAADGQFEIVGSTYAQNVPYSTDMWDNQRQVEVQREVIEKMVGASPVSFWNAERCWAQRLVPLLADNGYRSTWVEQQILYDSGTTAPEMAVRSTRLGDDDVVVFDDDWEMHGLNGAIDSGDASGIMEYLAYLHAQDTYRDFAVCYCEDAEATGLWDYESGGDPQGNWDNLDQILTQMESSGWIKLTTMSEYLETRYPTEELSPIVDGQGNWMIGPSQAAGYDDWFDFNANAPYLNQYRSFYDTLRTRIQTVEAQTSPGTPAAKLIRHAIWNFVAHQFEFGCIGCGWWGNQDYHKAETLEGAVLAAEAALSPATGTTIAHEDSNGDNVLDWTVTTPSDFYIVSETGGRLLRWFDLFDGEEILGNEIFMWGYYYRGWGAWYEGDGYNDDEHYMDDFVWNAWNYAPSAAPYTRAYAIRKHALNDFLSVNGGDDRTILDADYTPSVVGDDLVLDYSGPGLHVTKTYQGRDTTLSVEYRFTNTGSQTCGYELRIENELNPSLLAIMNGGRGSVAWWNGAETQSSVTPATTGVVNVDTGREVQFSFSETPADISGRETVHGLTYDPTFTFSLPGGETKTLRVTVGATTTSVDEGTGGVGKPRLLQNRPNPFNPRTTLEFNTPTDGPVSLTVHNASGQKVATLVSRRMKAGRHLESWSGLSDEGRAVASGVYFFRLSCPGGEKTVKGVLLR